MSSSSMDGYLIQNVPPKNQLIISDSPSQLYSIMTNSYFSYFVSYSLANRIIFGKSFSMVSQSRGNRNLAEAINRFHSSHLSNEFPFADLLLHVHNTVIINSQNGPYALLLNQSSPKSPDILGFLIPISLEDTHITSCTTLRFGRDRLLAHSFRIRLNVIPSLSSSRITRHFFSSPFPLPPVFPYWQEPNLSRFLSKKKKKTRANSKLSYRHQ